jgi:hypothetical protein
MWIGSRGGSIRDWERGRKVVESISNIIFVLITPLSPVASGDELTCICTIQRKLEPPSQC